MVLNTGSKIDVMLKMIWAAVFITEKYNLLYCVVILLARSLPDFLNKMFKKNVTFSLSTKMPLVPVQSIWRGAPSASNVHLERFLQCRAFDLFKRPGAYYCSLMPIMCNRIVAGVSQRIFSSIAFQKKWEKISFLCHDSKPYLNNLCL